MNRQAYHGDTFVENYVNKLLKVLHFKNNIKALGVINISTNTYRNPASML